MVLKEKRKSFNLVQFLKFTPVNEKNISREMVHRFLIYQLHSPLQCHIRYGGSNHIMACDKKNFRIHSPHMSKGNL